MGRIRVLDDTLVDQIAAGEVVERPASVVKELVENALDADAQAVTVELVEGGRERIRIVDDGIGMDAEDALLAVRRHATSKLQQFDDFRRLRTMGFRGEALASISSVSRFRLTTRQRDAIAGTEVVVEGGEPIVRPIGCPPGTTIDVRELFFNVPARKKFLRARHTEASHVADVCLNVALARPYVRLTLVSNGRRVREYLPTLGRIPRAQAVFSDQPLTPIEGSDQGVSIEAALGAPERATTGWKQLHLFVNGRPVVDRGLAHAIAFAFGERLEKGKYPAGVLHLEIDPADVDVNAHPQKTEVRFADLHRVKDVVTRVLTAALGTAQWRGGVSGTPALAEVPKSEPTITRDASYWKERLASGPGAKPVPDRWGLGSALRDGELFARAEADSPEVDASPALVPGGHTGEASSHHDASTPGASAHATSGAPATTTTTPRAEAPHAAPTAAGASPVSPSPTARAPLAHAPVAHAPLSRAPVVDTPPESTRTAALLLRFDAHWVLDAPPRVVDRARLARAVFDALESPLPSRRLVFPARAAVNAREAAALESRREALLALGLDVSLIGETDVALHAVPRLPEGLVSDAEPAAMLAAVLRAWADGDDARDALRESLALRAEPAALAALDLHPECARPLDDVALARLFTDRR
ncbi:MAG: DNA mismatch repair endonuclease MutL [Sandaracinus sp.]|nr:DNA mismatch repair endonuclease MutL [Sandaracinus sp.]MCB9621717.1 DNA mismatch repair endonuclease MutL [Sandaracinus sp.]MCB9632214.1 DNA mismatch repair endonuclease MutL [Sandaracinus sp.]